MATYQISNSLADFGVTVKGDGSTDDFAAIQTVVDGVLAAGGGVLCFDSKKYRITAPINVPTAVIIQGAGSSITRNEIGTRFYHDPPLVDANGDPIPYIPAAFTIQGAAGRRGTIRGLMIYQIHPTPVTGTAWTPNRPDREACILVDAASDVLIEDVLFQGVVGGIRCKGDNTGRLELNDIRGQVFNYGVEIEEAYDAVYMSNIHFWTFWNNNTEVLTYQYNNCDAFRFHRVDGCYMDGIFALAANNVLNFVSNSFGASANFFIDDIYCDQSRKGILIGKSGTRLYINSLNHSGNRASLGTTPMPSSVTIEIAEDVADCLVQVGFMRTRFAEKSAVKVLSTTGNNRLYFDTVVADTINKPDTNSPVFYAANATAANLLYLSKPAAILTSNSAHLFGPAGTNSLFHQPFTTFVQGSDTGRNDVRIWTSEVGSGLPMVMAPSGPDVDVPFRLQPRGDTQTLALVTCSPECIHSDGESSVLMADG